MPTARRRPSAATARRVEQAAGDLGAAAVARIEQRHEWFRALPAEQRSWVGLVAQAGIASFVEWFSGDQTRVDTGTDVFGTAPSELTRSISLGQTLDLVRTTVEVVEEHTSELAGPKDADRVREAVLRYSREVAFGAAEVYAQAAESRGAWDARLESVVVDAVLRGEADQGMHSRAAALGWGSVQGVVVLVGSTPPGDGQGVVSALHRRARRVDLQVLATVQGARVVAIVGSVTDPLEAARSLADCFGPGPLVAGPRVPHLFAAGRSARAAQSGYAAAPARPDAPRPIAADDLLAERALLGDQPARSALLQRIHRPLRDAPHLLETATTYLERGQSLEGSARALFVHPNTIRYRLGTIAQLIGHDLTDPTDAFTVRIALTLGRLTP